MKKVFIVLKVIFSVMVIWWILDKIIPVRRKQMTSIAAGRYLIDIPIDCRIGWGRQAYHCTGPFMDTYKVVNSTNAK